MQLCGPRLGESHGRGLGRMALLCAVGGRWREFIPGRAPGSPSPPAPPLHPPASCLQVIEQVAKMLSTSAKGAQPRGEEAQRVLSTFAASLKNPTLVRPPLKWQHPL